MSDELYTEALRLIRKHMQPGDTVGKMFMRVAKELEVKASHKQNGLLMPWESCPEEYRERRRKEFSSDCLSRKELVEYLRKENYDQEVIDVVDNFPPLLME